MLRHAKVLRELKQCFLSSSLIRFSMRQNYLLKMTLSTTLRPDELTPRQKHVHRIMQSGSTVQVLVPYFENLIGSGQGSEVLPWRGCGANACAYRAWRWSSFCKELATVSSSSYC